MALNWFESYLTNRSQYVEIDDKRSSIKQIKTGVPQGSILSPLLFIIYVNDLNLASNKFEAILYADDTSLSTIIKVFGRNRTSTHINHELSLIYDWLNSNKLSLNINKTKYMVFRFPQKSTNRMISLNLSIDGYLIERVKSFDFLGITINETLTWKDHIHKVSNKVSKVIGILSKFK